MGIKTAIMEAIDYLENQDYNFLDGKMIEFANQLKNKLESLLPKEKQQIIDVAIEFGMHGKEMMQERGEQYFSETFKQD